MTMIRSISAQALDIELHTPFGIAGGAQAIARNVLVTLELDDGTHGYGEAAPFPVFNGETQDMALSAVAAARSIVEGADVREWRRLALALRSAIGPVGSAQCATASWPRTPNPPECSAAGPIVQPPTGAPPPQAQGPA